MTATRSEPDRSDVNLDRALQRREAVWWLLVAAGAIALVGGVWIVANRYLNWINPMASPQIRYVIPSGFRGAIAMSVVQANGTQPKRVGDNIYQVVVPKSGKVDLATKNLFLEWHREAAMLSDGRRLPLGVELPEHDVTTPALWDLYTDGDGTIWKYVGPRTEMRNALIRVRLSPAKPVEETGPADGEEAIARPL
jgi:hypothetical protein